MEKKTLERALDMMTQGENAPGVSKMMPAALEMQEDNLDWMQSSSVQGFGISERTTEGERLDELALKVYVDRKLPLSQVTQPVPKRMMVPGMGVEVETDVEEIGKVELESFRGRYRPAMPGCGVGHPEVTVGTFGCLVRKVGDPSRLFILSNSHVLANEGVASEGDQILQWARSDGGSVPDDVIGTLAEWVPFEFTETGFPNLVDAAIAEVDPSLVTAIPTQLGAIAGVVTNVRRGMMVHKVGRTTGRTMGEITDTNYRLPLQYLRRKANGTLERSRAGLREQVLCTRYTAGGDSGSAVLSSTGNLVGLHFAGSPSTSIFNRIGHVFDALGIELVNQDPDNKEN